MSIFSRFEPDGAAPCHFGEKRLQRSQITKQADVAIGLVLLDALQRRELIEANLDYYGPRTDHGSSLSLAMHSLAASMAERPDQAYDYFRRAAAIDLEDSMSNSHHGIHAATQGGLLQAAQWRSSAVCQLTEAAPAVARLPGSLGFLGFSFVYRGSRHEQKSEEQAGPWGRSPTGRPQRRRISMRHRTFVVLVLLMALIAACGDGGSTDTTTAGATETTTGDTEAATTTAAAATTMAPEEGSLEGVELSLWGWSSSTPRTRR